MKWFTKILLLAFAFNINSLFASAFLDELAKLPILHEGRVKPLDTFARVHLLAFSGRSTIKGKKPIAWLWETIQNPSKAREEKIFKIRSPQAVQLSLSKNKKRKYSYNELAEAFQRNHAYVASLHGRDENKLNFVDRQLLELQMAAMRFDDLADSLGGVRRQIGIASPKLAKRLGYPQQISISYLDIVLKLDAFTSMMNEIKMARTHGQELSPLLKEAYEVAVQLSSISNYKGSPLFRIIPPTDKSSKTWRSPWEYLVLPEIPDGRIEALQALSELSKPSIDEAKALELLGKIPRRANLTSNTGFEVLYNRIAFFDLSLGLYLLAFLLYLGTLFLPAKRMVQVAHILFYIAIGCQTVGIVMRMWIMGRPPVSTLYESIIFVGFVVGLGSLLIERYLKNNLALMAGSLTCAALNFLSFSYASDGDTMGMLVAVLDSNFWLVTHVVTITIGYGFCIVAAVLGHLYLLKVALGKDTKEGLRQLFDSMHYSCLIALFFTLFGTILGGIWADQSWGRFWGWDPKENGALLICLWQLFVIHGRLAGQFKATGYALGMVIMNCVLALAWFGVNLLSVGLHSYGFTENIANNLAIFCVGETLLGIFLFAMARYRLKYPLEDRV